MQEKTTKNETLSLAAHYVHSIAGMPACLTTRKGILSCSWFYIVMLNPTCRIVLIVHAKLSCIGAASQVPSSIRNLLNLDDRFCQGDTRNTSAYVCQIIGKMGERKLILQQGEHADASNGLFSCCDLTCALASDYLPQNPVWSDPAPGAF